MRHWWESSRYRTDAGHNPIEANTHKWCYLHTAMMMMRYRQSCWTKKLLPSRWTPCAAQQQSLVGLAEKARNNMCDKSTYWPCKVCTVVVVQTIINPTKHFSILITSDDSPRRINKNVTKNRWPIRLRLKWGVKFTLLDKHTFILWS